MVDMILMVNAWAHRNRPNRAFIDVELMELYTGSKPYFWSSARHWQLDLGPAT